MYLRSLLATILLGFPCASIAASNTWSETTVTDLKAMHQAIADNDPATSGYANTGFTRWYEPGYQLALTMAKQVNNQAGYLAVMQFYANGFESEHMNVQPLIQVDNYQWPGFLVAIRNHQYQVVYRNSDSKLPAIGAELISCDGMSPQQMMKRYVIPYTAVGYLDYPSTWPLYVPQLFVDTGNPWYQAAERCIFTEGNTATTYQLHWQTIPAKQLQIMTRTLAFGPAPDFAIREFANNGIWISIPTFQPDLNPQTQQQITQKLLNISNTIASFRNKNIIVFDLRGNGGGNAEYSRRIIENLYGEDHLASLGPKILWNQTWIAAFRVSQTTINIMKQRGFDADVIAKAEAALKANQPTIINHFNESDAVNHPNAINPVKAKIYLLTDGRCGSDCWLFVRDMSQMPNVTIVGQPTHFMTPYTNPIPVPLPSGNMIVNLPMQVFIQPLDHFNEPFMPKCDYDGDMGDTQAVEKWLTQISQNAKNCKVN